MDHIADTEEQCSSTNSSNISSKKAKTVKRKKVPLPLDAKIGIVGCGIGGLSAALALQNAGFSNIVVYERDQYFGQRKDGYGLTLTYNPKGILEEIARLDTPSRSHYVFNAQGDILGYYGRAFASHRGVGQRGNLRVPRQRVREVMLGRLTSSTTHVQWGKKLVNFVDYSNADTENFGHDNHDDEEKKGTTNGAHNEGVTLYFHDGSVDHVSLLVGADGVRSTVQSKIEESNCKTMSRRKIASLETPAGPNDSSGTLQYLGIMLILGITSGFHHPLLDERGFYTVDGEHRLFTMPFEGSFVDEQVSSLEHEEDDKDRVDSAARERKTMWQLSFRLTDINQATKLRGGSPQDLLDEVLRRCNSWHSPVCDMFRSTPLESIWGTGLMDRTPSPTHKKYVPSRVVVLGDAMHAMSPFKGQGANQALLDGPLLASWLRKANVESALAGFEREMIGRTTVKVLASREAAQYLHSPKVLEGQSDFPEMSPDRIPAFLRELQKRTIGAHLGAQLDDAVRNVLRELNLKASEADPTETFKSITLEKEEEVLRYASEGNLSALRNFSLLYSNPMYIRSARSKDKGETCLHLAARNGHYDVCKWLISEVVVSCSCLDNKGYSPLHAAISAEDPKVVAMILTSLSETASTEWQNEFAQIDDVVKNIKDDDKRSTVMQLLSRKKCRISSS